jgi:hypothetical protein
MAQRAMASLDASDGSPPHPPANSAASSTNPARSFIVNLRKKPLQTLLKVQEPSAGCNERLVIGREATG